MQKTIPSTIKMVRVSEAKRLLYQNNQKHVSCFMSDLWFPCFHPFAQHRMPASDARRHNGDRKKLRLFFATGPRTSKKFQVVD